LNVKVTAYGRQTVPDRGVHGQVTLPIKILGGSSHITGTAERKSVIFCTQV